MSNQSRALNEQQLTAALEYLRIDECMGRPAYDLTRELFAAAAIASTTHQVQRHEL